MYKVTNKIPRNYDTIRLGKPLIFMEDEYGGQSAITVDDHCFVLFNGNEEDGFKTVKHWHQDAMFALCDFLNNTPDFMP